ncbi:hypothetical protein RZN37_28650, partial [Klebsiella pneumoniae]|nr:hypothetical protein [Klebsiella pneumoniae]
PHIVSVIEVSLKKALAYTPCEYVGYRSFSSKVQHFVGQYCHCALYIRPRAACRLVVYANQKHLFCSDIDPTADWLLLLSIQLSAAQLVCLG